MLVLNASKHCVHRYIHIVYVSRGTIARGIYVRKYSIREHLVSRTSIKTPDKEKEIEIEI